MQLFLHLVLFYLQPVLNFFLIIKRGNKKVSINRTVTLSFEGKNYPIIINMENLDRIEESGVNLIQLAAQCAKGDIRYSKVAKLISTLLSLAGCEKATQENVFQAMFDSDDDSVDIEEVTKMVSDIISVVFVPSKKKLHQDNPKMTAKA
jgi:hypothetical protein